MYYLECINDFVVWCYLSSCLQTARPAYFARKFEPVINQGVINQLETWLYGNYPVGTPGIEYYWQNSFHEQDTTTVASDAERTFYHAIVRLMAKYINIAVKVCKQTFNKILCWKKK